MRSIPACRRTSNSATDCSGLRTCIPGVLQRIGICYGIAATLALFFRWRAIVLWTVALFSIYCLLMFKAPYRNHVTGSLSQEDNFSRRIDETLFTTWGRHAYGSYPDNEGVVSTLPAIGSVLIGILVGLWRVLPGRPSNASPGCSPRVYSSRSWENAWTCG